ncbi:MAG: hypothetical protein JSS34_08120 [Proteobacteria bacterium]|nr:hypothetical protein [Pseudomonadota bacterium]
MHKPFLKPFFIAVLVVISFLSYSFLSYSLSFAMLSEEFTNTRLKRKTSFCSARRNSHDIATMGLNYEKEVTDLLDLLRK